MDKKTLHKISYILVLLGGLNWGLIGLLKINLVSAIFGGLGLADIIYIVIGIAAVYLLIGYSSKRK